MEKWWQKQNIYQIYLRSFFDSNEDGIGDIQGVIQKLDYLMELGITVIWISPHYQSPMDDNGYDISDFYQVSPDYGTIADFKILIQEANKRDMKVITDLVLNHTSDEHPWFQAAKDPKHPLHHQYHDYYIWQKPKRDENNNPVPPTRWIGWFGSPAWDYIPELDEYYLHIFSKKMPDLNWRNQLVREDMKKMIQYWIDLGVDGFRVDASNHLEKNWDFPDTFPGYENFSSIPKHHEYLQELGKELFVPNDLLTIGESGGASKEEAIQYAGYHSNEFNLLIQFGHCWADCDSTNSKLMGKWAKSELKVSKIKESFHHWYEMLKGEGWNVIYWHNHDQPRVVSHYGNDTLYHEESAKMLAIALYMMPGTAICYQGEEIGMTNVDYQSIDDFRDVEVFTEYQNMLRLGFTKEEALQIIRERCRDNARSPMQWNDTLYAGFSTASPWINVNQNYHQINLEVQEKDPASIFHLYQKLLHKRRNEEAITHADIIFIDIESDESFCYQTKYQNQGYLVLTNFTAKSITVDLSNIEITQYHYDFSNLNQNRALLSKMVLKPYEAVVFNRK